MAKDDELSQSLDNAIQAAYEANQQTVQTLRKAIEAVNAARLFNDDYRYKYANQILKVSLRVNNIASRYVLAQRKHQRRAAKG